MMTRNEAKQILRDVGINNRFSLVANNNMEPNCNQILWVLDWIAPTHMSNPAVRKADNLRSVIASRVEHSVAVGFKILAD